jgi:hypothetical protein
MLVAEVHGKRVAEAQDAEDYLTSAVFGHLRYVPPGVFWPDLFALATRLSDSGGRETCLTEHLARLGHSVADYSQLSADFWPRHPTCGEPDLLLRFHGGSRPALAILIEAKLWATKSGVGENDQLIRYLRLLDDLEAVDSRWANDAGRLLVYLTPRESSAELLASIRCPAYRSGDRDRLFRLQWQDVLRAARQATASADEPWATMLRDVAAFLSRRGLEYFAGFRPIADLPMLEAEGGRFLSPASPALWPRLPDLPAITTRRASWTA